MQLLPQRRRGELENISAQVGEEDVEDEVELLLLVVVEEAIIMHGVHANVELDSRFMPIIIMDQDTCTSRSRSQCCKILVVLQFNFENINSYIPTINTVFRF